MEEKYVPSYRKNKGSGGKAALIVMGGLTLFGLGWWGLDSALDHFKTRRAETAAHEARVQHELSLFNQSQDAFHKGNYSDALKLYDKAEGVFSESEIDPVFRAQVAEAEAKKVISDRIDAAERAEEEKIARLRSEFVPVEGDTTGLVEYKITPDENLWVAAEHTSYVHNLGDSVDKRSVYEIWGEAYDLLKSKGVNPDSLEVGDSVFFRTLHSSPVDLEEKVEESQEEFDERLNRFGA